LEEVVDTYQWQGTVASGELEALHAEAFEHQPRGLDWAAQLQQHSLGWVCARQDGELIGFVNLAWDGGAHAFLLDTLVTSRHRRRGVGRRLVAIATREAARAGCEWLHVDFEDGLSQFYLSACGFTATRAGLLRLSDVGRDDGAGSP
jgi:GNAT superfamily N-acetyltransferase